MSGLDGWNAHHHKVGLNTRETDNGGSKEMIYLPRSEIDVPKVSSMVTAKESQTPIASSRRVSISLMGFRRVEGLSLFMYMRT